MVRAHTNYSPSPTVPGSKERVEVMAARRAANQNIFNPQDRPDSTETAVLGHTAENGQPLKTGIAVDLKADLRKRLRVPKNFATVAVLCRKRAGLSVTELAIRSGMSRRTIQLMEEGRHMPVLKTLLKLFAVLGVELEVGEHVIKA